MPIDPEAFTTVENLRLTPLPCWRELPHEELMAIHRELVEEIERDARRREEQTSRPPLGRAAILRQDPRYEPNRLKKGPAPLAHAASRPVRHGLREAYRIFLAAYRHAADRLKSGALDVLFPEGSFPPALPRRLATASG